MLRCRRNDDGSFNLQLGLSDSQYENLEAAIKVATNVSTADRAVDKLDYIVSQFLKLHGIEGETIKSAAAAYTSVSRRGQSRTASSTNWLLPMPDETDFYVDHDVWEQLCYALQHGVNVLLTGPAGCGKTQLCYRLAKMARENAGGRTVAFEPFNFGAMSEPRSALIGNTHFSQEKGTWFTDSRFVRAVSTCGTVVLLDEISRAHRDAFNILLTILDDQGYIALDEREDTAKVYRADDVVFVATANLGMEYTGADQLDKSLKDRFTVTVALDFPPLEKEIALLESRCAGLSAPQARRLIVPARRQREMARDGEFVEMISTRALLQAGHEIGAGVKYENALKFCIFNQFSDEGGDASERAKVVQIYQKG